MPFCAIHSLILKCASRVRFVVGQHRHGGKKSLLHAFAPNTAPLFTGQGVGGVTIRAPVALDVVAAGAISVGAFAADRPDFASGLTILDCLGAPRFRILDGLGEFFLRWHSDASYSSVAGAVNLFRQLFVEPRPRTRREVVACPKNFGPRLRKRLDGAVVQLLNSKQPREARGDGV